MARKKTQEEKEYGVLLAKMRELLKTSYGQDVIWHILSLCDIYSDAFTGNSRTFYNEGKRSIGLQILHFLEEADPTIYGRLILAKQDLEVNRDGRETNSDGTYTDTDYGTDD